MALPNNTIQKVQTANGNKDIAPTMMTDSNKQYKAELPTLEEDDTIVVESQMPKVVRLI